MERLARIGVVDVPLSVDEVGPRGVDGGDEQRRKAMKRALLLATTMVITALLAVEIASADPLNSPNAQTFTLNCAGEEVTLVTNVHNRASVVNVVDSTSNLVLTEITATYTDEGGEILGIDTLFVGQGNRTGLQDELITCTAPPETFVDEETGETITVQISAEAFLTPLG
jgi:hypothetical protein